MPITPEEAHHIAPVVSMHARFLTEAAREIRRTRSENRQVPDELHEAIATFGRAVREFYAALDEEVIGSEGS